MTKNGKTDPVTAYEAEADRLQELQGEASALEARAQNLQSRIRTEDGADRVTEAATALLEGSPMEEAANFREELAEVRARLRVTRRAVEIQRKRVDEVRRGRDRAILEEVTPEAEKAARALAEALVEVGGRADALRAVHDRLREEGVPAPNGWRVRLFPLLGSEPAARLNEVVTELEEGFGFRVKRPSLDAARKVREKAHRGEEERKRRAGGGIFAGPDGTGEFAPGGGVKRKPAGGRKAGADDFKTAAAWGTP